MAKRWPSYEPFQWQLEVENLVLSVARSAGRRHAQLPRALVQRLRGRCGVDQSSKKGLQPKGFPIHSRGTRGVTQWDDCFVGHE